MIVAVLLALLLASSADAQVRVTRGPYLAMATSEAITIRWRTNDSTDSRVWVGPSPAELFPAAQGDTLTTEHELRVTGLVPGSRVYYAVGSSSERLSGGDSLWFRAGPQPGATLRVWVLGDSGKPGYRQNAVRDAFYAMPAAGWTAAILMLGDNAYNSGTDEELEAGLFAPYASFLRTRPLWPTRGNHDDVHSGAHNDYYDVFTLPQSGEAGGVPSGTEAWYSFDCGDVHFVCLDSQASDRSRGSPQMTWLAADLAATDKRWIIAFWHHAPYSKGSHDSDDDTRMTEMRENALPLLEAAGVDLVLGGHSHGYERSYLIDGHYGASDTFQPSMKKDAGDGPYRKPPGRAPHAGTVYVVSGASSQDSPGPLGHPAMAYGFNGLGSGVLDVSATSLRGRFLDDQGVVRDDFTIEKLIPISSPGDRPPLGIALLGGNPVRGPMAFRVEGADGTDRLSILDVSGRVLRRLQLTGVEATWDPAGSPPGVYFAVLEQGSVRRSAKVVLVR